MSSIVHEQPRGGKLQRAAAAVQDALTDHPFFDWRWAVADVAVIVIWLGFAH